jgi:hypothetical protein
VILELVTATFLLGIIVGGGLVSLYVRADLIAARRAYRENVRLLTIRVRQAEDQARLANLRRELAEAGVTAFAGFSLKAPTVTATEPLRRVK